LRCSINAAIPEAVNFLKDGDAKVRLATAEGLSELADRSKTVNLSLLALLIKIIAEFQPSIITAIPELVTLLKDSNIDVCQACATALSKFSEHGKTGNLSGQALLMRIIAELRSRIVPAILDMVKSINDGDSNVRFAYLDALSKLSQQGKRVNRSSLALLMEVIAEFRPFIANILPTIITLLEDSEGSVRAACMEALSILSEQCKIAHLSVSTSLTVIIAEFSSSIGPAIPKIVT
jgi:HEAT repeat protein